MDQLSVIFDIIGTPTEADIADIAPMASAQLVHQLRTMNPKVSRPVHHIACLPRAVMRAVIHPHLSRASRCFHAHPDVDPAHPAHPPSPWPTYLFHWTSPARTSRWCTPAPTTMR